MYMCDQTRLYIILGAYCRVFCIYIDTFEYLYTIYFPSDYYIRFSFSLLQGCMSRWGKGKLGFPKQKKTMSVSPNSWAWDRPGTFRLKPRSCPGKCNEAFFVSHFYKQFVCVTYSHVFLFVFVKRNRRSESMASISDKSKPDIQSCMTVWHTFCGERTKSSNLTRYQTKEVHEI